MHKNSLEIIKKVNTIKGNYHFLYIIKYDKEIFYIILYTKYSYYKLYIDELCFSFANNKVLHFRDGFFYNLLLLPKEEIENNDDNNFECIEFINLIELTEKTISRSGVKISKKDEIRLAEVFIFEEIKNK